MELRIGKTNKQVYISPISLYASGINRVLLEIGITCCHR